MVAINLTRTRSPSSRPEQQDCSLFKWTWGRICQVSLVKSTCLLVHRYNL